MPPNLSVSFRIYTLSFEEYLTLSSYKKRYVVYLELLLRGYKVYVGKTPNGEIYFIATIQNDKLYIQITKGIVLEKDEKRKYDRLLEINDNYQGIKTMHILAT